MTRYILKFHKLYYNFTLNFTTLKNKLHLLIELSNICTNYKQLNKFSFNVLK